ncbi:hypothetical protein SAMD00020551_0606 [Mesobacillus selenatarsenatis SF-1]|uniref:Uncharacterized protein n=1 Tax=Mesobacillus selenatarsenatis (strain DSM 18680 / JCM 14380 / FERM P-15431 / SF-1) TaxID=1321606 RepID=A0A0A8X2X9_MESS1|nr:hypothetical protein SAMD00020551_0606 [Mesobacillus selenatarsenatis SF-1]
MKPKSSNVTPIFLLVLVIALFFLREMTEKIVNTGYTI